MPPSPKPKNLLSTPIRELIQAGPSWFTAALFFPLLLANSFLSLGTSTLTVRLWVFLFGILLPLFLLFLTPDRKGPMPPEVFPAFPPWVWIGLGGLAIFPRLLHLPTLSSWPLADEGYFNYFSVLLREKWDGDLLEGAYHHPALYSWIQALLFHFWGPSLTTLWLLPALLSIATVGVAYGALPFFPRTITFPTIALLSFSFWPLYLGRISESCGLMVLLECLLLLGLAIHFSRPHPPPGLIPGLALLTGLGFYTYLSWAPVALSVALGLFLHPRLSIRKRLGTILIFSLLVLGAVLPLLLALRSEPQGYLQDLWAFGPGHDWDQRILLASSYLRDLFWGQGGQTFRYGPLLGGLLNPICVTLFMGGLVRTLKSPSKGSRGWVLTALFLYSLPAFLTRTLEDMRAVQLLPLFLLVGVFGLGSFLSSCPTGKRPLFLFLILGISGAWDLHHLFGTYPSHWGKNQAYYGDHKSVEFYRAYQILGPLSQAEGPGLVLLNFHPDPYDQTLFVASYGFNAATNPRLSSEGAKWAGLLVNRHEEPYLHRLFPNGKTFALSEGLGRRDGGILLAVVPLTAESRPLWVRWSLANQSLGKLTRQVMDLGVPSDQEPMLTTLKSLYPFFKGDRLLESRYWRIFALHHLAGGNIAEALEDEKKALEKGLPLAHLYNERGKLFFKEGRWREAADSFRKAISSGSDFTDAAENLREISASGGSANKR